MPEYCINLQVVYNEEEIEMELHSRATTWIKKKDKSSTVINI